MRVFYLFCAIVVMMSAAGVASSAPFQNGSFETVVPGSGHEGTETYYASDRTPDGIIGWTVGGPEGAVSGAPCGITRANPNFWLPADGSYSVLLAWMLAGGSIRQTFDTVAGDIYRVDFKLAGQPDFDRVNTVTLWIRDLPAYKQMSFTFDSTGKTKEDMGWVQKSYEYQAAGSSSTLMFSSWDALNPYFCGPVIDDVIVTDLGPPPTPQPIGDAKKLSDDQWVTVTGVVTVQLSGGDFYIEESDRSSGIRVNQAGYSLSPGQMPTLTGQMTTLSSGERAIKGPNISALASELPLAPLGVTNKSVGGGASGTPPQGQEGVINGVGLNNIGLLVRTTGRVSNSDGWETFYLNDGSGVNLKSVDNFNFTIPNDNDYVSVTGVVSCEKVGSDIKPVLLVISY